MACLSDGDCGADVCSATNGVSTGACVVATPAVLEVRLSTTDADGDGVITETEAGGAAPIAAAFYATGGVYPIAVRFEAPTCLYEDAGKPR